MGRGVHRFIASDGGVIAYRELGDRSARPLVMLHGLMAHGGFFREQAALARTFRIVNVDLRGHGASRTDAAPPTVERAAADVAELAAALDLDGAIGLGWSLGATVLWHVLAGPQGRRFAAAIVVDMTARVRNGGDWELGLSPEACEARSQAIRDDFPTFAAAAGQRIFAQPVAEAHRADAAWASAEFARNDPAAIAALWESLEHQDVRALLRRITHPTLIVHGGRSALYSDDTAEHLVSELPNARAIRFARSGHSPHIEEPDHFNRIVTDFAAELPPVASIST